ncbi:amidohydrolase family protein [Gordonia pseudamarae]|uniref:Amidohydrolase family protein n=1 Tax=Gordonia pseudamarae TaxID=2831662 RepID=A0ABX6IN69_9ACTN|nr:MULTISPECIES: amidohydrolase family protein [Gordonia]QHN27857.1 amidohydrolase family protein [Gordonia pseudamarae]QHN36740.1 amidohydrolase family protein [Gordonia pseudamarae]
MNKLEGVPSGIVDAHLHQWNPRRMPSSSDVLTRGLRQLAGMGSRIIPRVTGRVEPEFLLNPSALLRAYEPRDYLADAARVLPVTGARIDTVVCVESLSLSGRDTSPVVETGYIASLPFGVGSAPRLGAVIAAGDPGEADFGARLDEHAAITDLLRGVRWCAARHPDPGVRDFAVDDGALSSAEFLAGFEQIARRGLVFEVMCYSHQLYDVVILAREFPETTIVVDHMGIPVGAFGPVGVRTGATAAARADILRLWRERIVTLATYPNVVVKLSGLALPVLGYGKARWGNIGGRETLAEMVGPLVDHLATRFGAERLMFGSGFPVERPNATLEDLVGALADVLEDRGSYWLRRVFAENARDIYRIGPSGRPG